MGLILGPITSYPCEGYHNLPHSLYANAAVDPYRPSDGP